ncbi:MAG: hypothetical protein AB8I08_27930 [Sandaracinaceae bacterium]
MSEDEHEMAFTEEERREAEALARALERGHADDDLPEVAFQTAALLRHAGTGSELPQDRADAVLSELLEAVDARPAPGASSSAPRLFWRWLVGASGVAAMVALALWLTRPAPTPTALPAPSAALISAQMGRLSGDDEGYAVAMEGYRSDVYGALRGRYQAR